MCFLYCLRSATVIPPLSSRRVPGPTAAPVFSGAQSYRWSSVAGPVSGVRDRPIVIFGVETSHRVCLTVLHGSYCQFLSLCGTHVTESLVFGGVGGSPCCERLGL